MDITYGELVNLIGAQVSLAASLKVMQKNKQVDYQSSGVTLTDDVVVSLIGGNDAKTTEQVAYGDIQEKVKGDKASLQKGASEISK